MSQSLSFVHRFEPASRPEAPPLLMLHGTGGNENDLLPLGRAIAPGCALLSVRGQVLEHGMPRFFQRFAEGVFDEADLARRAHALADFVDAARRHYDLAAPIGVGYSNGANIAAAMLLLRPDTLAGAILLRAMVPFAHAPQADLTGKPILILSGAHDPIVPASNGAQLASVLNTAGGRVVRHVLPAGHDVSQADVSLAAEWVQTRKVLLEA